MAAVTRVLEEVGATNVTRIDVFNKIDRLTPDERRRLAVADPSAVLISAATGDGIDDLLDTIAARLALDQQRVSLEFDLSSEADRERLAWLYRHGRVHNQVTRGDRAMIDAELPRRLLDRVQRARAEASVVTETVRRA
jgi:GTP-binding protein HflX